MNMKKTCKALLLGAAIIGGLYVGPGGPARAAQPELRVGIEYGLTYLPFYVMQNKKLVEKAAAKEGIPDLKVTYFASAGGGIINDGLLTGRLDAGASGIPDFLTLWAKGRGRYAVKALESYGYGPILLMSRNPRIKSVKDFTEQDRIAVPAVRISLQATLLEIAAAKAFGPSNWAKLDPLTISRSHPDAMAEMLSGGQIDADFTVLPYIFKELATPGVHEVTSAQKILGTPVSNGVIYMTVQFHKDHPKLVAALDQGLAAAVKLINEDPRAAAVIFKKAARYNAPVDEIVKMIQAPGARYDRAPHGTYDLATFMAKTGRISKKPSSWQEMFFKEGRSLPGGS